MKSLKMSILAAFALSGISHFTFADQPLSLGVSSDFSQEVLQTMQSDDDQSNQPLCDASQQVMKSVQKLADRDELTKTLTQPAIDEANRIRDQYCPDNNHDGSSHGSHDVSSDDNKN